MRKSSNKQVQIFLDEIEEIDAVKFNTLQELREIVFSNCPDVNERIIYGGIMFSLAEDFGGLFVRKGHISFEFGNGFTMDDPHKLLEGAGKFRRHLKIRSLTDVKGKEVEYFVRQAV
jgi:hypothetical protein